MERKLLLLGILRQQEMHGYQLYEFIERDLAACTDLTKPTAYYLLNKMAEDGWIVEVPTQEGNRPPRKVYHLTETGEAAYQRLLRANLGDYQLASFSGDMGIAFLQDLDTHEAIELLQHRRSGMLSALRAFQAVPTHPGSFQWVILHQRHHLASELDWLDGIIAELQVG
jgi:DNA-binding PadR family transcriptional regulator